MHGHARGSHGLAVKPFADRHVFDIVTNIVRVYAMRFLAAESQTAIPIDLEFIPWRAAKNISIRHLGLRSLDQLVHTLRFDPQS